MWMVALFAVFILGCGVTHVFDVIDIWEPFYRLDAVVRVITALASVGTALLLIRITPTLILFPSASKWKEMNEELHTLNQQLEIKVQERTRELTESAAQFKFLADSIPQMVWTADQHGVTDYYNKRWCDYTGLTLAQSGSAALAAYIHQEDVAQLREVWDHSIQVAEPYQMEFRIKNVADQTFRWHLSRAVPMKDAHGNVIKWFGSATDIHEQKMKYEELEKVNEELDNFVYTASHDLKTPVANLEGLQYMINVKAKESIPQNIQSWLDMMQEQILKLKNIINDLSDVARIQREEVDDISMIELEGFIEEFKASHRELITKANAVIQTSFSLTHFVFSIRLLRSVVYNLMDNALKYRSPDRQALIKISAVQQEEFLVMTVEDNGIGIKPAFHHKVFDMFKRYNREQEGTGIGLYIVKRIVEKYEGKIELESEEQQGTVFRIYLKDMRQIHITSGS